MHVTRAGWPRVLLLVVLVGLQVVWLGQTPASAHSPISTIALDVRQVDGAVEVVAAIRYPDSDLVEGETVVAVAYSPDLRQTRAVGLNETKGERGRWRGTLPAPPGHWQIEVDAVRKTKGLQSIGFTVGEDGTLAEVSSPSPLPATIVVPGAPAEEAGSGLREGPRTSATRTQLTWAVTMGVLGLLFVLVIVRRMAAKPDGPAAIVDEEGWQAAEQQQGAGRRT